MRISSVIYKPRTCTVYEAIVKAKIELALILGVVWAWLGDWFTPGALEKQEVYLRYITTLIVLIAALARLWYSVRKRKDDDYPEL